MVNRGASHLVLMGRSEPTEQARAVLKELKDAGSRVMVARADVSQRDEVARVLQNIDTNMPPLRGVIHAAGVLGQGRGDRDL